MTTDARAELESQLADKPDDDAAWQIYGDALIDAGDPWGDVIALACAGKATSDAEAATGRKLRVSELFWKYGAIHRAAIASPDAAPAVARLLGHSAGRLVRFLSITGRDFEPIVETFGEVGPLPLLEYLSLTEENPAALSAYDFEPLWTAAPRLRHLRILMGRTFEIGEVDAPRLETLVLSSGALARRVPISIGRGQLPNLMHLELGFGKQTTCNLASLVDILAGVALPKLQLLALIAPKQRNKVIEAVAQSPLLPRLRSLIIRGARHASHDPALKERYAAQLAHLKRLEL